MKEAHRLEPTGFFDDTGLTACPWDSPAAGSVRPRLQAGGGLPLRRRDTSIRLDLTILDFRLRHVIPTGGKRQRSSKGEDEGKNARELHDRYLPVTDMKRYAREKVARGERAFGLVRDISDRLFGLGR